MNANIYRPKEFFCIQKIRFAPRFVPPVELAICSSLIKAFIEEIYNRFIVYLFPLIWCSMCGREILELFSLLRRPFARFGSAGNCLVARAEQFASDVFAIFICRTEEV
jgi:hypothetical protein